MSGLSKRSIELLVGLLFAVSALISMAFTITGIVTRNTNWWSISYLSLGICGAIPVTITAGAIKNWTWTRSFVNPNAPRWAKAMAIVGGVGLVLTAVLGELYSFGLL